MIQCSRPGPCIEFSRVDVNFSGAASVPGGEEHAAATALVLDVLERVHEVGNAAQAEAEAETGGPCAVGVWSASTRPRDLHRIEIGWVTHWVVFPVSYATVVKARWPQAGQSAGAGERFSEGMGVAFW